ncbi:hypothetical protein BDP81DRAFT_369748 [Colletotrichum phormii]|uniref:Uncharacterized protein n=1 Tax=Colletotrichum phormii TaxID=359342 RepID=A0AAI9ZZP4_9PEZI|nr:uncharacterized protein BDP81DRAFT_369748 [Colletotrichum phormii]KAK1639794.1 hypothetical protein BDP81DRAFT_369748 [Colletotrichum phormii]
MSSSSFFRRSDDIGRYSGYDYSDRRGGERDRPSGRDSRYNRRSRSPSRPRSRSRSRSISLSRSSPSRSSSPDRRIRERKRGRDRDRDRMKDLDRDQSRTQTDLSKLVPPSGPRLAIPPRGPPTRTFSSPVHSKSGISIDTRLDRGSEQSPWKPPALSTTPASSAPPTPRFANGTTSTIKITASLRQLTQRSNEQGAIRLRKDVVEARAKAREKEHAQSHPKYAEFPSLRDYHRKLEKKDTDDLGNLGKEMKDADQQWQASAEAFAATLLQAFTELQQKDKDRRSIAPSPADGLETRLNSRLETLENQHKEAAAEQQKQMEELRKTLSVESAKRKALGVENETLKKKVQELQGHYQSLTSKADDQGASIKRLQEPKPDVVPPRAPPKQNGITAEELKEVKTLLDQHESVIAMLKNQVCEHDNKLGEMDIDLISDSCGAIATTLPRLEQNGKKAADDVTTLQTKHRMLGLDTEQLESETAQLRSGAECIRAQLKSETESVRKDALEIKSDTEHLKTEAQQLRSDTDYVKKNVEKFESVIEQIKTEAQQLRTEMTQLQSSIEKLASEIPRPPNGDKFLAVRTFTTMNATVFKTFSNWIEDVKKRIDIVERQMPPLRTTDAVAWTQVKTLEKGSDQKSSRSAENSRLSTPSNDLKVDLYEGKLKDYDTRIKVLEAVSRQSPRRVEHDASEPTKTADVPAKRRASDESASIKLTIEALKEQLSMIDQSIKAISESAKLTSESQAADSQRIQALESQAYETRADHRRLDGIEKRFATTEEKVQASEAKMDFMQHNIMNVDAQINNLTTESLYQAILHHIDRYHPTEAAVGPKVDQMARQVTTYEQRLHFLERQLKLNDEPANKKRRLSSVALTNGRH